MQASKQKNKEIVTPVVSYSGKKKNIDAPRCMLVLCLHNCIKLEVPVLLHHHVGGGDAKQTLLFLDLSVCQPCFGQCMDIYDDIHLLSFVVYQTCNPIPFNILKHQYKLSQKERNTTTGG